MSLTISSKLQTNVLSDVSSWAHHKYLTYSKQTASHGAPIPLSLSFSLSKYTILKPNFQNQSLWFNVSCPHSPWEVIRKLCQVNYIFKIQLLMCFQWFMLLLHLSLHWTTGQHLPFLQMSQQILSSHNRFPWVLLASNSPHDLFYIAALSISYCGIRMQFIVVFFSTTVCWIFQVASYKEKNYIYLWIVYLKEKLFSDYGKIVPSQYHQTASVWQW